MEIKLEIKNRFTGEILFSFSKENNTIKDTVIEAVKKNADLCNANLCNANLCNADLCNANLCNANLYNANLYNANLRNADLRNADLRNADLRNANLYNADLRNADLRNADLDKRYISVSQIGSRKSMTTYCFDDDIIWCGCFRGTLTGFEIKVNETHKNNPQYLQEYTGFIKYLRSLK